MNVLDTARVLEDEFGGIATPGKQVGRVGTKADPRRSENLSNLLRRFGHRGQVRMVVR